MHRVQYAVFSWPIVNEAWPYDIHQVFPSGHRWRQSCRIFSAQWLYLRNFYMLRLGKKKAFLHFQAEWKRQTVVRAGSADLILLKLFSTGQAPRKWLLYFVLFGVTLFYMIFQCWVLEQTDSYPPYLYECHTVSKYVCTKGWKCLLLSEL